MGRKYQQRKDGTVYLAEFFGATCVESVCKVARAKLRGKGRSQMPHNVDLWVSAVGEIQQRWDELMNGRARRNKEIDEVTTNTTWVHVPDFQAADLVGMMDELVNGLSENNVWRSRFAALRDEMVRLLGRPGRVEA